MIYLLIFVLAVIATMLFTRWIAALYYNSIIKQQKTLIDKLLTNAELHKKAQDARNHQNSWLENKMQQMEAEA